MEAPCTRPRQETWTSIRRNKEHLARRGITATEATSAAGLTGWSSADEHQFSITGPVPEKAFGRSLHQQLSHFVGEFFDTVAEELRRGKRHGEVIGQYALDILHVVRDAGCEDHPWRPEPGAARASWRLRA